MKGKCALYDIETELKLSHIIPKFAFDYLKRTGGKYLSILYSKVSFIHEFLNCFTTFRGFPKCGTNKHLHFG